MFVYEWHKERTEISWSEYFITINICEFLILTLSKRRPIALLWYKAKREAPAGLREMKMCDSCKFNVNTYPQGRRERWSWKSNSRQHKEKGVKNWKVSSVGMKIENSSHNNTICFPPYQFPPKQQCVGKVSWKLQVIISWRRSERVNCRNLIMKLSQQKKKVYNFQFPRYHDDGFCVWRFQTQIFPLANFSSSCLFGSNIKLFA